MLRFSKKIRTYSKYLGFKKTGAVDITTCAGLMADKIQVTNITTNEKDASPNPLRMRRRFWNAHS